MLLRFDGVIRNDDVSADFSLLAVGRAVPIRRFFAWPGKRNYEGLWWSSTVRAHVPFASLLELAYLMWADFEPDIVAIAAQPLALLWPRGTTGHKNRNTRDAQHGSRPARRSPSMRELRITGAVAFALSARPPRPALLRRER
ncbi:hypothetical protein [Mycobacterium riyadhense]|uniref:hypothetical protein n=1 Tax=Mycobacterium riyadhense TaxID=486698 RepID=UPI001EF9D59D|nr:hypothetical protein [Mycobacterium riyadhense]